MGYNSTATTLTLTAKLTPLGRQKMVSSNNTLIKSFSLGDSDANYYSALTLVSGEIPSLGGNVGPNASFSNSTTKSVNLRSMLVLNTSGLVTKPVAAQSINVLSEVVKNGFTTVSGSNISHEVVDRGDLTTDTMVNLFYSFGLPLNASDDVDFTGTTYANGGFSDTAISGLATSKILIIAIDNSTYGECIDGKTIKIEIPYSAGTYTLYSTYQAGVNSLAVSDSSFTDSAQQLSIFGNNVAALVSDDILKPNGGDASLSWSTGYNTEKPFSVNKKQTYNLQTNSNLSVSADTLVGMAYLDKGILVVTHPTIVNDASIATPTVSFDSVSTNVYQSITCIADRGEFGATTNPTFEAGDIPRISEVALYDDLGNIIAIAKTDRHITKNINEFLALGIKITL